MHRVIRDHLERVLADSPESEVAGSGPAREHLKECEECREEIARMREHSRMLRNLRPVEEVEPRPGFYARVMERIEAEGPISIWNVFSESPFGRRIAVASMALALAIGVYMFTAEQPDTGSSSPSITFVSDNNAAEDQPGLDFSNRSGSPDRDAVLVNLVTYREQ